MNLREKALSGITGLILICCATACSGQASIAELVGQLKSTDHAVRLRAIDQLAGRGPAAVAPLESLLKDASAEVRARVVWALGQIGPAAKPAVNALAELLKDSDASVRRQAVRTLVRIQPDPAVVVPLYVALLDDADVGVRLRALNAVSELGAAAVPSLIAALDDPRADFRECLALREIGPAAKDAVPALIKKMQDPRPEIRREAILALAAMDEAALEAVAPIAAALQDPHTRAAATYAMGRIGRIPVEVESVVRANAQGDDAMLSTTSLWALARVHPEDQQLRRDATRRLIERLKSGDPLVRVAAARGLASLPPAPELTLPLWENAFEDADETTVLHALDALASLGADAVPGLTQALKHEKIRRHVAGVLGRIGPAAAPAVEALSQLVADKDEQTAQAAILALAGIGPQSKQAIPVLIDALGSGSSPNACAAAYALGRIGPEAVSAQQALNGLLSGGDRDLALVSAWALVQICPASPDLAAKLLPVLTTGLGADRLPLARRGAAEALGQLGAAAKAAVPALQKTLDDDDPSVRAAVGKALEQIQAGG